MDKKNFVVGVVGWGVRRSPPYQLQRHSTRSPGGVYAAVAHRCVTPNPLSACFLLLRYLGPAKVSSVTYRPPPHQNFTYQSE